MDETLVRELVARREEPRLDFKESPHGTNDELAKDLMAMANVLGPGARAHILLGVQERADGTGEVVGADVGKLGDAEFQQKVETLLNRVPRFTFATIQTDGKSVGVFEIEGTGHRPFYPLRDSGVLRRFECSALSAHGLGRSPAGFDVPPDLRAIEPHRAPKAHRPQVSLFLHFPHGLVVLSAATSSTVRNIGSWFHEMPSPFMTSLLGWWWSCWADRDPPDQIARPSRGRSGRARDRVACGPAGARCSRIAHTAQVAPRAGPRRCLPLATFALELKKNGVHVLVSNSSAPQVFELYARDFRIEGISATRMVNCRPEGRGKIVELLIS